MVSRCMSEAAPLMIWAICVAFMTSSPRSGKAVLKHAALTDVTRELHSTIGTPFNWCGWSF